MMVKRWLSRYWSRQKLLAQEVKRQRFIVIDIELTGLDPKKHEIVSLAWVCIEQQIIRLSQAEHYINKDVKQLEQSPIFHGINSQDLVAGESLHTILKTLSEQFSEAILVFHNASLDWGFLKTALRQCGYKAKPELILDTFQIEKKRLLQQGQEIAQDALTLSQSRKRYGLPQYSNHHALTDAIATAELLLAQSYQIARGQKLLLKDLV